MKKPKKILSYNTMMVLCLDLIISKTDNGLRFTSKDLANHFIDCFDIDMNNNALGGLCKTHTIR